MRIISVGVSHTTAPLELLERVSIPPGELDAVLSLLRGIVAEAFVLSTCNRTELYAVVAHNESAAALVNVLERRAAPSLPSARDYFVVREGIEAVRHALRVAAGLDSMVLGEDQIQAQMKRALAAARGAEMLGATLERMGAAALGCGKRVRAFTGIGQHAISLESLAVDAAAARIGDLRGQRAVVLGSGSSASVVARRLRGHEANVTIVGRTPGAAAAVALDVDAASAPWERLPDTLVDVRLVVSCTSAPHHVLTRDTLARRMASRADAPLLCVDLGMPHDIDADVATIPGVSVVTLAELGEIAERHAGERARHLPAAEAIVQRETNRFMTWMRERHAAPSIADSQARADAIADAELKRALARLQAANAHDRAVIAELTRRLARKLAHENVESIKRDMHSGVAEQPAMSKREEAVS